MQQSNENAKNKVTKNAKSFTNSKPQISNVDNPQKIATMGIGQTVVFKLKGRLAKNYKLKENESLFELLKNGDTLILNKNETPELLLRRLMRYSYNCEIISPKFMRDEFIELVNSTLDNYND